jgi:hypothetical protein
MSAPNSDTMVASVSLETGDEIPVEKRILKVGELIPGGLTIKMILGQSATITVFTTVDAQLRWVYHDDGKMPAPILKIIARFDTLMAEISSGVPEKYQNKALVQLGKALFSAVDSHDVEGMESHFAPVAMFIKSKALPPARLRYIGGSTIASVLIVGVFAGLAQFAAFADKPHSLVVIGGIGGSIGGFISVLQRSTSIDVDYNWDKIYLLVQGAARILLGMLFGMFVVMASEANLLLGFVKDSLPSLIVLAAIAGVSERFVPEIIKRLEAQASGPA